MGYYINPPDRTKEKWLEEQGQEIEAPAWPAPDGQVLVCLVSNPMFSAAAIVYDGREFKEFTAPDTRPRKWYVVPFEAIIDIEPLVQEKLNL